MRRGVLVLALAVLLVGPALLPTVLQRTDTRRPNVLVIVTDDQSWDSVPRDVPVMPYLQGRILDPADHWVVFANGFVHTPVCCPSRATLLTGRYAHHTGVRDNGDGWRFDEGDTLATWLDAAGYHTGLVGKYLNGYPFRRGPYVPEGWDRWWGKEQGSAESVYHDYTLIEDGLPIAYGDAEADYATDVFAAAAVRFLREAPSDRPFFLWFAPTAPHPVVEPAARHEGRYAELAVPSSPSFGEPDVGDKPAWVRALPPMDERDRARMVEERRRTYETLLAVDEAVRAMLDVLEDRGELEETMVVYVSDNGFSFGEHRWFRKTCPYDECIRVPLFVRLPGVAHRIEPAMVSTVDVAPTIADLAGIAPGEGIDGGTLLPLLRDGSEARRTDEVFVEWVGDEHVPAWRELRLPGWAYVELATGERELYDLRRDPYQLENLADDPARAALVGRLSAALAAYGGS